MRGFIKTILVLALAVGFVGAAGQAAQAGSWPYNINSLYGYLNDNGADFSAYTDAVSGAYSITALGFEAGYTNRFYDENDNLLFTNQTTSDYGLGNTQTVGDINNSYYTINGGTTKYFLTNPASYLEFYVLNEDWSAPSVGLLTAGTIIVGFDDGGAGPDDNHDDLILALKSAEVPLPGALWLLGSGLVGLVGLRRKMSA